MAIVTGPNYAGAVGKYLDFKQQQQTMKEQIRSNKAMEQIARDETAMKMSLLKEGGEIESGHIDKRGIVAGKNIQESGRQDRFTLGAKQRGDIDFLNRQGDITTKMTNLRSQLKRQEMGLEDRYVSGRMRLGGTIDKGKIAEEYRHRGTLQDKGYDRMETLQDDKQAHDLTTIGRQNEMAQTLQRMRNQGALATTEAAGRTAVQTANIRGDVQRDISAETIAAQKEITGEQWKDIEITAEMAEYMGDPSLKGQVFNQKDQGSMWQSAMQARMYQNIMTKKTQEIDASILSTNPTVTEVDWSEMDDQFIDEAYSLKSSQAFATSLNMPDPSNQNSTPMKRAIVGFKQGDKKHHKYGNDIIKKLETNMKHFSDPNLENKLSNNQGEIDTQKSFTITALEQLYTAKGLDETAIQTKMLSWATSKANQDKSGGAVQDAATQARIKTLTRNYGKHSPSSTKAKDIARKLKLLGIDVDNPSK